MVWLADPVSRSLTFFNWETALKTCFFSWWFFIALSSVHLLKYLFWGFQPVPLHGIMNFIYLLYMYKVSKMYLTFNSKEYFLWFARIYLHSFPSYFSSFYVFSSQFMMLAIILHIGVSKTSPVEGIYFHLAPEGTTKWIQDPALGQRKPTCLVFSRFG